jgi:hypothetical protein
MDQDDYTLQEEKERADRLKRFDDVLRMLLLVMTVEISLGFNSYKGLNLWSTFPFFLMSLSLWIFAHLIGVSKLLAEWEILFKLYAWSFAVLVAAVVLAKSLLQVSQLEGIVVIPIIVITILSTLLLYRWFSRFIPENKGRQFKLIVVMMLLVIFGGGVTL